MKKKQNKLFHLIHYMEDSSPKLKKFNDVNKLNNFVKKFNDKHPNMEMDGYWIEYIITNIMGEIKIPDESLSLENVK